MVNQRSIVDQKSLKKTLTKELSSTASTLDRLRAISPEMIKTEILSKIQKTQLNNCSLPDISSCNTEKTLAMDYRNICSQINALDAGIDKFLDSMESIKFTKSQSVKQDACDDMLFAILHKIEQTYNKVQRNQVMKKHPPQFTPIVNKSNKPFNIDVDEFSIKKQASLADKVLEFQNNQKGNRNSIKNGFDKPTALPIKDIFDQSKSAVSNISEDSFKIEIKTCSAQEFDKKNDENKRLQKPNHFDTILKLHKISFIDKEQSALLKKRVIRKDKVAIQALTNYEYKRDLKVLVTELREILDSV